MLTRHEQGLRKLLLTGMFVVGLLILLLIAVVQ